MVDVSDLNPDFAARLAKFRDALTQAGINSSINSGYRSPEYQQSLINQGVRPAAQPWSSFHQYGLAADLTLDKANYQRMWDLAPQYGLHPLGAFDPGHVQMPGTLADDIAQYHLQGWRPASQPAPAQGAIAYSGPSGQPSRPVSTTPGTTLNSTPLDIVLNAESGDRNINNTHQGTSSGQAQGNLQITTGTWNDFAPKAGVDLKQYPTPQSAPRSVQIQVGNTIPLNRWADTTVQAVLAKYPGIDTSQTLGAIQSAALAGSGGSRTAPGAAPATPAPGATLPGYQPGSPANTMAQNALKQLGGLGASSEQPPQMRLPDAPQAQAVGGSMMMRPGGQNIDGRMAAAQALQQQGFLMQPSLAANTPMPSSPVVASQGVASQMPGMATGMPALPGTTLNSPSALQMALMSGSLSPYDMYGRGTS